MKKHGDNHFQAINAMISLASIYRAGYKMPQVLALFEHARDTTVTRLGDYHPITLKILHNLALTYRVYGRTREAIDLLEQVRERRLMILGGDHPATLATLQELANAYYLDGELGKALPLYQQAAAGVEKLEFLHSDTHRIVNDLARCHEQLKQYEQAEIWWRKWVAMAKEKYGTESFKYAGVWGLTSLGLNLLHQEKYSEAEPILRENLAVLEKKIRASGERITPSYCSAPSCWGGGSMTRPSRISSKAVRA